MATLRHVALSDTFPSTRPPDRPAARWSPCAVGPGVSAPPVGHLSCMRPRHAHRLRRWTRVVGSRSGWWGGRARPASPLQAFLPSAMLHEPMAAHVETGQTAHSSARGADAPRDRLPRPRGRTRSWLGNRLDLTREPGFDLGEALVDDGHDAVDFLPRDDQRRADVELVPDPGQDALVVDGLAECLDERVACAPGFFAPRPLDQLEAGSRKSDSR